LSVGKASLAGAGLIISDTPATTVLREDFA